VATMVGGKRRRDIYLRRRPVGRSPDRNLACPAGATYIVEAGVLIDLAALAIETAASIPLRRRSAGAAPLRAAQPRRHLPISYFARFGAYPGR